MVRLKSTVLNLQSQLSTSTATAEGLRASLSRGTAQLTAALRERDALHDAKSASLSLEVEVSRLRGVLGERDAQVSELLLAKGEWERENIMVASVRAQVAALQAENQTLRSESHTPDSFLSAFQHRALARAARSILHVSRSDLAAAVRADLFRARETAAESNAAKRDAELRAEKDRSERDAECKKLAQVASALERDLASAREANHRVRGELAEAEGRRLGAEASVGGLTKEIERLEEELRRLQEELRTDNRGVRGMRRVESSDSSSRRGDGSRPTRDSSRGEGVLKLKVSDLEGDVP